MACNGTEAMSHNAIGAALSLIECNSRREIENVMSHRWPYVIVMTIKGNLKHRIEKLGGEQPQASLTRCQAALRNIAEGQQFEAVLSSDAARPTWGGGALFYCEAVEIALIKETKALFPFRLQSKHVVCSHIHLQAVIECLEDDGRYDVDGVVAVGRAKGHEAS